MYNFDIDAAAPKSVLYAELLKAADALTSGEPDGVANMANISSLLWQFLPDLNWAGFYRMGSDAAGNDELILGPFQGKAACIRIALDKGVCGAAAASGQTQLVDDVHAFPGHIACDADSRSELVVPVVRSGQVVAVIDLDSPVPARFDADDAVGIEALAALLSSRI
ncbi:GAF domain-containing protein [Sphingorhabdus arenilitoris]|uniref:GAF domain-containing protein n=1 Tax=Sphingorhabdus arenilitoris TaxID=1490041 RepID=A0ABV8RHQ9_9SPHN